MNLLLSHIDWGPIIYGLLMFLGIWLMWVKLMNGRWMSLSIDIAVFTLVFSLHGGTMAGGFAAMIAASLAGWIFPMYLKRGG